MVDARTKSIAFFELFSQGLSVPKCHFRSDEIVEIWGTLTNNISFKNNHNVLWVDLYSDESTNLLTYFRTTNLPRDI